MTRIVACLVLLVAALTLLLATNPARGQLGSERVGLITPERVTLPAPDADVDEPSVEANTQPSVEAQSSQGRALDKSADTAAVSVHTQPCGNGEAGAESRLGLMERSSVHGHCESR